MREHDQIEEIDRDIPVFAVAPVRSRARVRRPVLLAITIGVMAFVAGIAVASSGPTRRETVADATQATSSPAAGVAREAEPRTPKPTLGAGLDRQPQPGSSAFLAGFDSGPIIRSAEGGDHPGLHRRSRALPDAPGSRRRSRAPGAPGSRRRSRAPGAPTSASRCDLGALRPRCRPPDRLRAMGESPAAWYVAR